MERAHAPLDDRTTAMRMPCGHDADAELYRTSSCTVGFCQRCRRAYEVGPQGALALRIVLVVSS